MTTRGKFVLAILVIAIAVVGALNWKSRNDAAAAGATDSKKAAAQARAGGATATAAQAAAGGKETDIALVEPLRTCPVLEPAGTYAPKDNTVDLELSEYAGYSGLIVANGGLEPSENSHFFRKHGFKVRIKLSEEESWSALNAGRIAASATTTDVLAIHCRNFQVTVPAQIGFSRGADGIIVRKDIRRINDLKGKVLVTSQFTESDFFIRTLAQEAGLEVAMVSDLKARIDPNRVNLAYVADAFAAGDLFLKELQSGGKRLAGCVTWAPKTTEVVEASQGAAYQLTTNKNLLIIADVLIVNKGFATANPKLVAGLVEGLLEGNRQVRDSQAAHIDTIARAFKWDRDKAKAELAKVHLSNLPESLAFFSGAIDAAGSFNGIFQSAILAYGPELVKEPQPPERFADTRHLEALKAAGAFAGQTIAIAPIRSAAAGSLEGDPLLSKDIRFLFQPNSYALDLAQQSNLTNLDAIKRLLQVSPGSTILLRGHVDNALVEQFRKQGGESFVRQMALKAMELSKNRANEIRRQLMERLQIDGARIEVIGRGWEEPAGADPEQNRRVEVQWFTLE